MADQTSDSVGELVNRLEQRVDELVGRCRRLTEENRMLRASQESLNNERAALLEKSEHARSRIEAMISRLKAMENN